MSYKKVLIFLLITQKNLLGAESEEVTIFFDEPQECSFESFMDLEAFLYGENNRKGYLAVDPVLKNSYQYAYFGDSNYFDDKTISRINNFGIVENQDGSISIKSRKQIKSYLAIAPVGSNNYQYALFATKEFLIQNPSYTKNFQLIQVPSGLFRIQSNNGVISYLAIGAINQKSFQYAIFAADDCFLGHKYSRDFVIPYKK